ncbi:protein of unknown function [Methylacidimicrobium sp. AP8]|nr:protein of unknown function [Methylacidimicrobium sp. AP8]
MRYYRCGRHGAASWLLAAIRREKKIDCAGRRRADHTELEGSVIPIAGQTWRGQLFRLVLLVSHLRFRFAARRTVSVHGKHA